MYTELKHTRKGARVLFSVRETSIQLYMPEVVTLHQIFGKYIEQCREFDAAERCAILAEAHAAHYPVEVFPEDSDSTDAISARMARLTSANIAQVIREVHGIEFEDEEEAQDGPGD